MRFINFFSLFAILIFLTFCTSNNTNNIIPDNVATMLDSAKSNKQELLKVINHYKENPKDSLKLKSAYFLISNMYQQAYYKAKLVDTNKTRVDFSVLDYPDYKTMVSAWDSIEKKIGTIDYTRDTIIYDLQYVKADYLIENIDLAFKAWQKPWAKFLNFDEFCEYILPYRSSNEPIESWRKKLFDKYSWVEDSVKDKTDPVEAAILINNDLKSWYKFDARFYRHPTDLGLSEMMKYKMGRCEDMTNLAIYSMRSQGIPVMSDYTPAWPNTGNNHAWNAIINKDHKIIIFMGGLDNPYEYQLNNKKAKVYRKTFAIQQKSLAKTAPKYEKLPGWLASSHYIDVTKDYIPVANVKLKLTEQKPDSVNFAYICVFNSGEWKAIHWSKIYDDNSVNFTDMGNDIAYLVAYYKNGKLIPAANQFIFTKDNKIEYNIPDTVNKQTITLYSTTKRTIVKTTDEIEKANFENGATYELSYWNKKWIKIGEQKSENNKPLIFKDVPKNALFWLVKKDSNNEERIFTIDENGNQKWW